ncbi:hypothetical protein Caci_6270 [Catenulispora acidiphila DSM 44928]|uniref:Secretion protein HlyD family protein n=1 Tax=Catenulispora acidiphila (strain DSM 44928 / JCM 14897 / NBRC 102108 / NRRL B-24433 / ID139908) TaxID=479433 RepID=C7QK50_CATAD|nr:biotin/lipoyl-binding protein [Catenulispora acidiphila]ACU75124.1 hypothetical protein Caci_6270 [Catenulispora acidiphila DSM 44928]
MVARERVRGMNAAFTTGEAGVGEMRPAKPPLRPKQLIAAVVAVAVGGTAAVVTYKVMADPAPTITGQVTPAHAYYLNFGDNGTLSALNVAPGQQVKAGQLLATEDTAVDQSDLRAAQAQVSAADAALTAAEHPQTSTAAQNQLQVTTTKAQAAVTSAQSALTLAQGKAKSSVDMQAAVVASRQRMLNDDQARYAQTCTGAARPAVAPAALLVGPTGSPSETDPTPTPTPTSTPKATPPPTSTHSSPPSPKSTPPARLTPSKPPSKPSTAPTDPASLCQNLETQIAKDADAVSEANAQLTATQSAASDEQQRAADQVTQAQALLQTVQNQPNPGSVPDAATIAQAKSNLATAQALVAKDQQALATASIVAPADGVVADTAGAVGDRVDPAGIHLYGGPAGQTDTSGNQQQGFQLFAGQPTANGNGNNAGTQPGGYVPLITLYSEPMTVTAQVPEAQIGQVHAGQPVTLSVVAVNQNLHGTVDKVLLDPARVPGAVYYDVVISMAATPPGVLCGMTVNVALSS